VQKPVERLAEQIESFVGELGADRLQIDPDLPEPRELGAGFLDALQIVSPSTLP